MKVKRIMKFFLISLLLFVPQIVLGQTKNVLDLIVPFNSESIIELREATLDDDKNISIYIEFKKASNLSILGIQKLEKGFGVSKPKSAGEIRTEWVLRYLFNSVRDIFKVIPTAESIKLYVAFFSTERDVYGKPIRKNKKTHGQFVITKKIVEKLNWDYITELLHKLKNNKDLLKYLSKYEFYSKLLE